ncbi:hypothetical protein G4X40_12120 [Rhodococcus sp. D2-41]|uniref:Uncharacterized protein n=1 Tax=Speluncibacter jeojiensis TaxID=2710754 RepID=A0A9X4LX60_9ACTN|nr:hypothetical protein [Rhodococcus sp. D2-41]MDG3010895.1 hypothetical protein [Rhodococcus sp. D2-41]MDG3013869.1 hypothetical protein [Corynebacteriales bacterium D3-21]
MTTVVQPSGDAVVVDRLELTELVDTALERTCAGSERVGLIHLGAADALADGRIGLPVDLTSRLHGELHRGDVLGCLGRSDYAALVTGSLAEIRAAADRLVGELENSDTGESAWTEIGMAVAVDAIECAVELLDRAGIECGRV